MRDVGLRLAAEALRYACGDVRITRGQNQLNGARAEVDFKTGVSRMLADGDKGRVKGLLTPEDKARAKQ